MAFFVVSRSCATLFYLILNHMLQEFKYSNPDLYHSVATVLGSLLLRTVCLFVFNLYQGDNYFTSRGCFNV